MKMHSSVSLFLAALLVAPLAAQDLPPVAPLLVDAPETEPETEAADAEDEVSGESAEEKLEHADVQLSPAAVLALEEIRRQMELLADLLAGVTDASSASAAAPRIAATCDALRNADFSSLAEEDEELVASEFSEDMLIRLDVELARLADADYYGNTILATLFGLPVDKDSPRPAPVPTAGEADVPVPEAGTESVLPK